MSTKPEEPTLHELVSRLAEMEQEHARLREELTSLRAERAAVEEQAGRQSPSRMRKSSRRRVLTRGLEVAAATVGVGTLLELSSGHSAAASTKAGDFASSVSTTPAVKATGSNGADGIRAISDGANGNGIIGSGLGAGVFGDSPGTGVFGISSRGTGVFGLGTGSGNGVQGRSDPGALAGLFEGDVKVTGTLSKGEAASRSTTRSTRPTSTSPIPSLSRPT